MSWSHIYKCYIPVTVSLYREFVMGEFSNVMYWLEFFLILGIIYSFDARDQQKSNWLILWWYNEWGGDRADVTLEGLECVNSPFSPHLLPCWGSRGKLGTLPGGIIFTKRPPYTSLVHLRMCHSVEMLMTMKVSWTGLPPHLKPIYTPGGNSTPHVQQNFYFCIAMGKCT